MSRDAETRCISHIQGVVRSPLAVDAIGLLERCRSCSGGLVGGQLENALRKSTPGSELEGFSSLTACRGNTILELLREALMTWCFSAQDKSILFRLC